MKKLSIFFIIWALLASCETFGPDEGEFDLNKKSLEVIETNNAFGLDLLRNILQSEEKENVMISPASISLALGMTYNGSENSTKEAFEEVLNYEGLSREEVNQVCLDLIASLVSNKEGKTLEIANSIWYRNDLQVYDAFISLNNTYFDAEVRELNTVEEVNNWVKEKTHNKIEKILEELSPEMKMILMNAIYFNANWEVEFDKEKTENETFYFENESGSKDVEMMYTQSEFNYQSNDLFSAVELPYKDGKYSMHLFLPGYNKTLSELAQEFNSENWNTWMDNYKKKDDIQVVLPKFTFEYENSLAQLLASMGLEVAFSESADFSSISDVPLFISDVIHKTFVDVNEEGTEAAAVTAVILVNTSAEGGESGPLVIRFDQPFIFAITENTSSSIVFIGRVKNPEYEN